MDKKELILKAKKIFSKQQTSSKELVPNKSDLEKYDLNLKVLEFNNWCKEKNLNLDEIEVFNFILKMAIWYEMRYPNQIINSYFHTDKIINGSLEILNSKGYTDFSRLLNHNELDTFHEFTSLIEWKDLFDFNTFLKTISEKEKEYLEKPKFELAYKLETNARIYFNDIGEIIEIEEIHPENNKLDMYNILKSFIGLQASSLVPILMEYGQIEDGLNIYDLCEKYQNKLLFNQKILDMVMYKIIERGGVDSGVERGFLFAREFKRDISVPLMYISRSPSANKILFNEYLKAGGSLNLTCCMYYFSKKIETIERNLADLYQEAPIFTKEEKELHEEIIQILKFHLVNNDQEENKKLKKII